MRALFLAIVVFVSFSVPVSSQQQPNGISQGDTSQSPANNQSPHPDAKIATTHFAPGQRTDHHTYRAICDSPRDKDHADLCQQWRVAEANESQAILNAFGIGLLLFTFFATVAAALGTWRTVGVMRNTGERQLRAYIAIVGGHIRMINNNTAIEVGLQIKNAGQTPAYRFQTFGLFEIVAAGAPFPAVPDERQRGEESVLLPGQTADIVLRANLAPQDTLAVLTARTRVVYAWGRVDCIDAFNTHRWVRFRIIQGHEVNQGAWAIGPHPLGYDAN